MKWKTICQIRVKFTLYFAINVYYQKYASVIEILFQISLILLSTIRYLLYSVCHVLNDLLIFGGV